MQSHTVSRQKHVAPELLDTRAMITRELRRQNFSVGSTQVGELLKTRGYSLQTNRKMTESKQQPGSRLLPLNAGGKSLAGQRFPGATRLLVTADCGGSHSPRTRLWRLELQRLADATGLIVEVRHFPAGTSKWNKIEHRKAQQRTDPRR